MPQQWYISRNDNQYGPYSWDDLQNLAEQGNVSSNDLIWSNSLGSWTSASNVPNLLNNYPINSSGGAFKKKNPMKLRFSIRPTIRIMPYGRVTTALILIFIAIAVIIAFINGDLGSLQLLI